ncbi:hypothetical protein BDA99DRAFT_587127 [Phascolomyces articulosus]|uniref:Uncharacterized protein n=1 Tax=Phascolomyces articulosus TaxID=60185 RepID=A0AAD5PAN2_9FUNG|nr:hypothetical protein BDA99DRAFT_587127 [Phascolomyces articulosus]
MGYLARQSASIFQNSATEGFEKAALRFFKFMLKRIVNPEERGQVSKTANFNFDVNTEQPVEQPAEQATQTAGTTTDQIEFDNENLNILSKHAAPLAKYCPMKHLSWMKIWVVKNNQNGQNLFQNIRYFNCMLNFCNNHRGNLSRYPNIYLFVMRSMLEEIEKFNTEQRAQGGSEALNKRSRSRFASKITKSVNYKDTQPDTAVNIVIMERFLLIYWYLFLLIVVKHLNLKTRKKNKFCWILLILTGVNTRFMLYVSLHTRESPECNTNSLPAVALVLHSHLLHESSVGFIIVANRSGERHKWTKKTIYYYNYFMLKQIKLFKTQHFNNDLGFTTRSYFRYSTIKYLHLQYNANINNNNFILTEAHSLYSTTHSLNASNITNGLINK